MIPGQVLGGRNRKQPFMTRGRQITMCHLILGILFASSVAAAENFVGDWKVVEVITNEQFPYHKEIKYPESFSLRLHDSILVGNYENQHGFKNEFELVEIINEGHELILRLSGPTKYPSSWAVIHKVKMIDGRLHGIVVTSDKKFEWIAEKAP